MQRAQDLRITAIALVFALLAAVIGARAVSGLLVRALWTPRTQTVKTGRDALTKPPLPRLSDYAVIQDRNLFNDTPPQPGTPAANGAPLTPQAAPPPPFDYQLSATCIVTGGQSFALFSKGEETLFARKGREISPGAVLTEIKKDRVVVTVGTERRELLLFADKPASKSASQARPYVPPQPQQYTPPASGTNENIRQIETNTWAVDRREIEQAMGNLNQLITQLRVIPLNVDGKTQGFTVANIVPGSLFTKLGLMDGDVIKEVNGVPLTGIEVGYQALMNLSNQTSVQVTVMRRNQPVTLSYEIR